MCVVDGEALSSWTLPGCWANTDETANRTVSPATTIVLVMTSSDAGVCALRKSYGRPHRDVRGLQIPMDHPGLMRGLQRLGDLLGDRQRLIQGDRPLREPVG